MSLLMRLLTRRGRKAEGPKHPDDEKACEFARGPSAVPGPQSPNLTGSAPPESTSPMAQCPQR